MSEHQVQGLLDYRDVQAALRASAPGPVLTMGSFVLTLDPASDHPYRNYAIPCSELVEPTDVDDLVDAFQSRVLVPRLEFVTPAPSLERALRAAGFVLEPPIPVLAVTPAAFRAPAPPPGIDVRLVTETADLHAAAEVQSQAYSDEPATEADVARLRRLVAAGGHVALACIDGHPAGSGVSTAPALGASEIAAIAASASFRRRGLATAVAVVLTRQLFRQEIAPFLQVHAYRQLYERLGYRQVADLIFATLPPSTV